VKPLCAEKAYPQHGITERHGEMVMNDSSMMGGNMMMIGMGLIWLLVTVFLLLAIAALKKYLRKRTLATPLHLCPNLRTTALCR
jgi:uncharacterized membrane protein